MQASSVCLRRHHVSRPHNTGCRLIVAVYQQSYLRLRPPLCVLHCSPCISPNSTMSASSTFSPFWTRTVAGLCPWPVSRCIGSSWTRAFGIYYTSAPRVSWRGKTTFWDPRCVTWLFAGIPVGSCKCATSRIGWRPRFRRTSAANMSASSAPSWAASATCECLCEALPSSLCNLWRRQWIFNELNMAQRDRWREREKTSLLTSLIYNRRWQPSSPKEAFCHFTTK